MITAIVELLRKRNKPVFELNVCNQRRKASSISSFSLMKDYKTQRDHDHAVSTNKRRPVMSPLFFVRRSAISKTTLLTMLVISVSSAACSRQPASQATKVTVVGESNLKIEPDQAVIVLSVVTIN